MILAMYVLCYIKYVAVVNYTMCCLSVLKVCLLVV